jgi:pimeloyl-ACP methyl ester carboxylesterase
MRGEFVDLGGTRLYYYAAGTRGGGDPIVFLHGFPGSAHSWRGVAPLMPVGRRRVLVDLLACGRSDGPRKGSDRLETHVQLVRRLLDDLMINRAAIVGQGIGASIAAALTLAQPERVSALALLSPIAMGARPRGLGRLARASAPVARALGGAMVASFLHGSAILGYADREVGRHHLDQALNAYTMRLGADSIITHLRLDRDPAIAQLTIGAITAPTAVIVGSEDPFLPSWLGARLRSTIPDATLGVIGGARHFINEDAPSQCGALICDLLNSH